MISYLEPSLLSSIFRHFHRQRYLMKLPCRYPYFDLGFPGFPVLVSGHSSALEMKSNIPPGNPRVLCGAQALLHALSTWASPQAELHFRGRSTFRMHASRCAKPTCGGQGLLLGYLCSVRFVIRLKSEKIIGGVVSNQVPSRPWGQ